jgi:hypothetical protein
VTYGVEGQPIPGKPRPERLRRASTESGLQALSGFFVLSAWVRGSLSGGRTARETERRAGNLNLA